MFEEVDIFFNEDDFAEPFELTPPDGSLFVQNGIWTNAGSPQTTAAGVVIINDSPTIEFPASKIKDVVNKTVVRRISTDETFYVFDPGTNEDGFQQVKVSRKMPQ